MKIISLDIGNVHTGVAYADDLGIIATPYTSIATRSFEPWFSELIKHEPIETVVVGLPITLRGTESDQTKMVKSLKQELEKKYPTIKWLFFDERFTSKDAQKIIRLTDKKNPASEHAVAAALILQTYLESRQIK